MSDMLVFGSADRTVLDITKAIIQLVTHSQLTDRHICQRESQISL